MSVQNFVNKFTSKRDSHKQKNIVLRMLFVITGFILLLPGIPLLGIFPEAGIPLVLFGLILLSHEYSWAGKTLIWFSKGVDAVINWYRRLPRAIRICVEIFFTLLTIWLIYLVLK